MMEGMISLLEKVTGNPATTSLKNLILNLLVFVGFLTGLYFGVSDVLVGLNSVNSLYDLFLIVFFALLYWLARFQGRTVLVAHLLTSIGLLLCALNFFINSGIHGPTLMVFLVVLAFVTMVHRPRAALAYLVFGLTLAIGCLAVQYFHPEWIVRYLSTTSEFWDISMTFLFCFLAIFTIMRLVLRFFDRILEQSRAAQAAVVQSEKMAALGEILANISHDINTPLGVIGSSLEVNREWWIQELPNAAKVLAGLTPEGEGAFWAFLAKGVQEGSSASLLDSRESRLRRTALEKDLESAGAPEAWSAAQDLVALGILEWDLAWTPLVAQPQGRVAFEFAIKALILDRSNRNAARAYGKLQSLMGALKSYSRSDGPGKGAVPTNVAEGLDTVLTLYATSQSGSWEIVKDYGEVPVILGKPDELIQVWTNLVQNALHAMPRGGVLSITLAFRSPWVEVTVSDTGAGVPPGLRDQIFTPFFTTKERGTGTGLGLGIVRRIVTEHGGQVDVSDAPGGGARFTVRLPLSPL